MSFIKVTPAAEGMDEINHIYINSDRLLGIGIEELEDGEFLMLIFDIGPEGEIVGMSIRETLDELPELLAGLQ